ncbi:hypothetical protein [Azospirillum agricola]|uniref:hypothetical protein n=1 Tax=Azospirillum agricola TaxID=1720247 RepID=UPI000A0F0E8E|nr:hypothetical protein [Azospirillum agricola]SMH33410.1 hypothetical protein SAMN02982994_0651 [Azospirillum lipoferum]
MPHIERTDQGDQYVLPGTERRTVPGLPYAAEPDGQLTLHFYAPPRDEERRARPTAALPAAVPAGPLTAAALPTTTMPAPATPATEKARGKGGTASAAGLFGRRLAHFPQVFDPA